MPNTERRKHQRYTLNGSVYAFNDTDFGQIIDISMGGLALLSGNEAEWESDPCTLDIVFADEDLCHGLENIPFQKVSHALLLEDESDTTKVTNRCSLQFKKLTYLQRSRVEIIITNNSSGCA